MSDNPIQMSLHFSDLNAQYLRDNYLFGIPLEDIQGNKTPIFIKALQNLVHLL